MRLPMQRCASSVPKSNERRESDGLPPVPPSRREAKRAPMDHATPLHRKRVETDRVYVLFQSLPVDSTQFLKQMIGYPAVSFFAVRLRRRKTHVKKKFLKFFLSLTSRKREMH